MLGCVHMLAVRMLHYIGHGVMYARPHKWYYDVCTGKLVVGLWPVDSVPNNAFIAPLKPVLISEVAMH